MEGDGIVQFSLSLLVCLSRFLSFRLTVFTSAVLSDCQFVCLFVFLFACLIVRLLGCWFVSFLFDCQFVGLVCLFVRLFVYLPIHVSCFTAWYFILVTQIYHDLHFRLETTLVPVRLMRAVTAPRHRSCSIPNGTTTTRTFAAKSIITATGIHPWNSRVAESPESTSAFNRGKCV